MAREAAEEAGKGAAGRGRPWRLPLTLWLLVLLSAAQPALAQATPMDEAAAQEAEETTVPDTTPALASVGVRFGLPGYRTGQLSAALQTGHVGFAAGLGYGTAGFTAGLQARYYPPLPIPLPTYLGAGVDLYAGRLAPHIVLGAHVPLSGRWRLDLEGGVAWTPLLDRRTIAPYLSLGVAYAWPVELQAPAQDPSAEEEETGEAGGPCQPGPPQPGRLDAALRDTVDRFVLDARAAYGSIYRGLSYNVRTISRDVSGDQASVLVHYSGRVTEILTGTVHRASGEATVGFRWNGCSWSTTSISY